MAAAARESNERSLEDRGGYGKSRKRPFRRSTHTTPYDRPATAIRNPSGVSDGWLSKLVDPAQRLIAYGAHKLFASVFRKRLPAPPLVAPPSQSPNTERETGWSSFDCGSKMFRLLNFCFLVEVGFFLFDFCRRIAVARFLTRWTLGIRVFVLAELLARDLSLLSRGLFVTAS